MNYCHTAISLKYTFNPKYQLDTYLTLGGCLKCHNNKCSKALDDEDEQHLYSICQD